MKNLSKVFLLIMIVLVASCAETGKMKAEESNYLNIENQPQEEGFVYYSIGGIELTNIQDKTYRDGEYATGYIKIAGLMNSYTIDFDTENYASLPDWDFNVTEAEYAYDDGNLLLRGYAVDNNNIMYEWDFELNYEVSEIGIFRLKQFDDDFILWLYVHRVE